MLKHRFIRRIFAILAIFFKNASRKRRENFKTGLARIAENRYPSDIKTRQKRSASDAKRSRANAIAKKPPRKREDLENAKFLQRELAFLFLGDDQF